MNEKAAKNAEKEGKGFKGQFWFVNDTKESKEGSELMKRPESSISRQFQPRKQQGLTEAWAKQAQENRDGQAFNYTPFKSAPVIRAPSVSLLREGTPNPPNTQALLQPQSLQQTNRMLPHSGLSSVYQQSYMRNQYPGYGVLPTVKDMHPQGQSTPKMAPHLQARSSLTGADLHSYRPKTQMSAVLPRPMSGTLWKNTVANDMQPPPGPYRPASAMNPVTIARPNSRAASELGLGVGLNSRYQSYCTLPRPEHVDYDQQSIYGSEVDHMGQQINMIYGSYNPKPHDLNTSLERPGFGLLQHRPQPAMLTGPATISADYAKYCQPNLNSHFNPEVQLPNLNSDPELFKLPKDVVYFDALSLLSVFQVVCAIVILTCGIFRIIWHAKWFVGVELAYAVSVLIASILGIYASSKRSYCATAAAFTFANINAIIGLIPLIFGLMPAVPFVLSNVNKESFANDDESFLVDYLLSFSSFVEIVLASILAIYCCRSFGIALQHVDNFQKNFDGKYDSTSLSMQKNLETIEKKMPLQ
uniref:MARVEL domain-containing protein n=1 Tax=Syphacia muris TaxID=451379 RepID=A0A0N5AEH6_9BILA